ncbi:hypothetical protein RJ640_018656 [Escallonia rubra]|uniref:40S ribosomal protein S29 n=1 Tax=Escallonia rubra TaxID=112253 RepID=A0AA88UA71_9ASTE|nr:hypothetical protein RJ640_018656 [Escallonia rubra]
MGHANVWNSHPKSYGPGSRLCRVCGNSHGMIRKYGLMCCRHIAEEFMPKFSYEKMILPKCNTSSSYAKLEFGG